MVLAFWAFKCSTLGWHGKDGLSGYPAMGRKVGKEGAGQAHVHPVLAKFVIAFLPSVVNMSEHCMEHGKSDWNELCIKSCFICS